MATPEVRLCPEIVVVHSRAEAAVAPLNASIREAIRIAGALAAPIQDAHLISEQLLSALFPLEGPLRIVTENASAIVASIVGVHEEEKR